MTTPDAPKPLVDLVDPGATLMLAVLGGAEPLEARPMTAAKVDGDRVWILADRTTPWISVLAGGTSAHATLSDTRANTYVSLHGTLTVSGDRALIDELWSPPAGAFFENGKEDPNVVALVFEADGGSYWTAPSGRLGSLVSMVRAKLTGAEASGEHGDVAT